MDLSLPPAKITFMEACAVDSIYYTKVRGAYVCYLRASEKPHSRLDTEDQLQGIEILLDQRRCRRLAIVAELEPLEAGQRPRLEEAISICREQAATLVFGKLDRMRGAKRWLDQLFSERIRFRAADLPHLTWVSYQSLRSREERRLERVGQTIRTALSEKRASTPSKDYSRNLDGLKDGPKASLEARQERARFRARHTLWLIDAIRRDDVKTLAGIATHLNGLGHKAPRGGKWSAAQVSRVIAKRAEEMGN